jgi:hypothetical protein
MATAVVVSVIFSPAASLAFGSGASALLGAEQQDLQGAGACLCVAQEPGHACIGEHSGGGPYGECEAGMAGVVQEWDGQAADSHGGLAIVDCVADGVDALDLGAQAGQVGDGTSGQRAERAQL